LILKTFPEKCVNVWCSGYRSNDEAIITAGGVSLKEMDPMTMESKFFKGLFTARELLDLQVNTGGYNLQAAFSSGWGVGASVHLIDRPHMFF